MIIHRYSDGSQRYEYEIGDRVIVEQTVHGGWFNFGPTHSNECYVEKINQDIGVFSFLEVRYSEEWGTVLCAAWHLKPHPDLLKEEKVILYP